MSKKQKRRNENHIYLDGSALVYILEHTSMHHMHCIAQYLVLAFF